MGNQRNLRRRRADIKGPGQPLGRALILTLIECFGTRVTDSSPTHTLPPSQPRQSVPCGSSASVIRYHYHLVIRIPLSASFDSFISTLSTSKSTIRIPPSVSLDRASVARGHDAVIPSSTDTNLFKREPPREGSMSGYKLQRLCVARFQPAAGLTQLGSHVRASVTRGHDAGILLR